MPIWLAIVIIVSIIGGLSFATFAMWLQSKEKQAQIGAASSELAQTVAAQQKQLAAAERRLQNLEAIVTSQAWDGLQEDGALPHQHGRIDQSLLDELPPETEQASQLAQRLKA
ncbi:MAG: hypothetical protein RhofKO_11500 [Rhodothermales bacterium]